MLTDDAVPTATPGDPAPADDASYPQPGLDDATSDVAVDDDRELADRLLLAEDADIEAAAAAADS